MAQQTPKIYRNQTIYSIFVRNYSPEGTFESVRRDLPRIRTLGVDIIWLMPIHPVGEAQRKGSLGSPYAIRDYRAVNPDFGTMEDFTALVGDIHALGMKCIIDVVYNHTSPDSVLAREHPEWFYRRPDGGFGNRVGDWTDIIDLDYSQPGLWDYQITEILGAVCRWFPLRRGPPGSPGLLEKGPCGGGDGPPRLHLARRIGRSHFCLFCAQPGDRRPV